MFDRTHAWGWQQSLSQGSPPAKSLPRSHTRASTDVAAPPGSTRSMCQSESAFQISTSPLPLLVRETISCETRRGQVGDTLHIAQKQPFTATFKMRLMAAVLKKKCAVLLSGPKGLGVMCMHVCTCVYVCTTCATEREGSE